MTDEHKGNLVKKRKEIVKNICLDELFNDLMAKKILTDRDVQNIQAKTGDQQAELLLDILPKKSDSAYKNFISVLCCNNQAHVANLLEFPEQDLDHIRTLPQAKGNELQSMHFALILKIILSISILYRLSFWIALSMLFVRHRKGCASCLLFLFN